jgi:hypothetical protein
MAEFLLAVHMVEGEPTPAEDEIAQAYKDVDALNEEIRAAGAWVFAGGLEPADRAVVVQARGGKVTTTDGPFAESKEQLGGFWVIDVPNREAALEWASKATIACRGAVEVRPFQAE